MNKSKIIVLAGAAVAVAGAVIIDLGFEMPATALSLMFLGVLAIALGPMLGDL
jgi:hypothetical protein